MITRQLSVLPCVLCRHNQAQQQNKPLFLGSLFKKWRNLSQNCPSSLLITFDWLELSPVHGQTIPVKDNGEAMISRVITAADRQGHVKGRSHISDINTHTHTHTHTHKTEALSARGKNERKIVATPATNDVCYKWWQGIPFPQGWWENNIQKSLESVWLMGGI